MPSSPNLIGILRLYAPDAVLTIAPKSVTVVNAASSSMAFPLVAVVPITSIALVPFAISAAVKTSIWSM